MNTQTDGKIERMKTVSAKLREASRAYYQESREIMSNYEYDALYDALSELLYKPETQEEDEFIPLI